MGAATTASFNGYSEEIIKHMGRWQSNIRIYHKCEGRLVKSVPRIAVWHHEACRVMTNGDPRDRFLYPTLKRIMDSCSCSPLFFFLFKNKLSEVPETAKIQL